MAGETKVFDISPAPSNKPAANVNPNQPSESTTSTNSTAATNNDDEGHKIAVSINSVNKTEELTPPEKEIIKEEAIAQDLKTQAELTPHHEKNIIPLETASEAKAVEKTSEQPETKPDVVEVTGSQASDTKELDNFQTRNHDQSLEQQVPKIFDTKQYHLPIQQHKSHNSAKHMLGFIVAFLLLAVIGVVVAIDAGWLDIGVKLPFDLIS